MLFVVIVIVVICVGLWSKGDGDQAVANMKKPASERSAASAAGGCFMQIVALVVLIGLIMLMIEQYPIP